MNDSNQVPPDPTLPIACDPYAIPQDERGLWLVFFAIGGLLAMAIPKAFLASPRVAEQPRSDSILLLRHEAAKALLYLC